MRLLSMILIALIALIPLVGSFRGNVAPDVHGYTIIGCKWTSPLGAVYYFDSPTLTSAQMSEVDAAAQLWNDVPALITLQKVTTVSGANVIVATQTNPSGELGYTVITSQNCSNGVFSGQFWIYLDPDQISSNLGNSWTSFVFVACHEFGHALGLGHNSVNPSTLMYGPPTGTASSLDPYLNWNIFVPQIDDINGLASIYGWAASTNFAASASQGQTIIHGTIPPTELWVTNPNSGSYAELYSATTLPSPKIALMMGWVYPYNLYRFDFGWATSSPSTQHSFVDLELDNDGIKMVDPWSALGFGGPPSTLGNPSLQSNHFYFVELVIMVSSTFPNDVSAAGYVYQISPSDDSSNVQAIANFRIAPMNLCGGPCGSLSWSQATYFHSSVWTDASSNPTPDYALYNFWNFQGSAKYASGSDGSVASGSLITMGNGSKKPVQDVSVGDIIEVYDVRTMYQTSATVNYIRTITSDSLLTIHTSMGLPFRADANPMLKLHVLSSGVLSMKPITEIAPGDRIFNYDLNVWVVVTDVTIANGGQHTMYDLFTDPGGFTLSTTGSLVLEYIANGYPDCPCNK
jgi:hypothetical protein